MGKYLRQLVRCPKYQLRGFSGHGKNLVDGKPRIFQGSSTETITVTEHPVKILNHKYPDIKMIVKQELHILRDLKFIWNHVEDLEPM